MRLHDWTIATSVALLASCGSRTALYDCDWEGEEQPCSNECGEGVQRCSGRKWSSCIVRDTERTCRDACGTGWQVCHDGHWAPCVTQDAILPCTNACGVGTQSCHSGELGPCTVRDVQLPCTNVCGTGTQWCRDGALQACVVRAKRMECTNDCGAGTQWCEDGQAVGVCEVEPVTRACSSVCGTGTETCQGGKWQPCTAPLPRSPSLTGIVRDFHDTFPDMELPGTETRNDRGAVLPLLGDDDKPVYASEGGTTTISGRTTFDQWFRDVRDVNVSTMLTLPLTEVQGRPGLFRFRDSTFFPIDDQLFGNESRNHNYHFTLEIATRFRYSGGEEFRLSGDDDIWVFINRHLVVDLGGLHSVQSVTLELDSIASMVGIQPGNNYPMHIFFAERHTVSSQLALDTTIGQFAACD